MGSYSSSFSQAIDNRQAVTDQGLGISSSGTNNRTNTALQGHIFNVSANVRNPIYGSNSNITGGNSSGGKDGSGGAGGGGQVDNGAISSSGGVNFNLLDNGAVNKAFDFAAFSLSETLGAIIGNTKQSAIAQQNTMDTIGQAITQASTTTQQATQAAGETMVKNQKTLLMFAGVGVAAWWLFFKGKK